MDKLTPSINHTRTSITISSDEVHATMSLLEKRGLVGLKRQGSYTKTQS